MSRYCVRKDDDYCHPWRVEIDGVSYVRCTTWGMAMQEVSELTAREDIGHDTWERTMAITNHYWKRSTIDSKNPQKVEAAQWDGTRKNAQQIEEWVKSRGGTATWWNDDSSIFGKLYVRNTFLGIDRNLYASPGSFIVRSEKGKFFPCYEADFLLEYSIV